jgi:hypothetical protein
MTTKIKAGVIAAGAVDASALSDNSITIAHLNCSDGTNGQVLSTDGSGTLSFSTISGYTDSDVETYLNTSEVYTDATNNRLGIGTSSPDADLSLLSPVYTSGGTGNGVRFQNQNNNADAIIQSYYSGTSPSALLSGANAYLSTGATFTSFDNTKASSYALLNTNGNIEFGNATSGNPTTKMLLDSSGNVGIGTASPLKTVDIAGSAPYIRITDTRQASWSPSDKFGGIEWYMEDTSANAPLVGASIYAENAQSSSIPDQNLIFATAPHNDASGPTERMRITSTGSVGINETSPDFSGFGSNGGGLELDDVGSSFTAVRLSHGATGDFYMAANTGAAYLWGKANSPLIIGTNNAERIRIQDGTGRMGINTVGIAYSSSEKLSLYNDNFGFGIKAAYTGMGIWNTESSGGYIAFAYGSGGAAGGSISYSGGTTSYNTSSDYRLKENVNYTWDATTRLKQLKPARFNWISDDTDTLIDGFLAHEVSSIVPEAVTGEKDAVYTAEEAENSAGAEAGDIKVQVMDNSKLVPLLVKTIQELEARITTLEE